MRSGSGAYRRRLLLGLCALSTVAALALAPAQASATSSGCTASGTGLPWYGLNSAYTCLDVYGRGDTVWIVDVTWAGIGTVCNYRFQLQWFNVRGRRYEVDNGPLHVGCSAGAAKWETGFGRYWTGARKQTGEVCGYLYESGRLRHGVPCEAIHP